LNFKEVSFLRNPENGLELEGNNNKITIGNSTFNGNGSPIGIEGIGNTITNTGGVIGLSAAAASLAPLNSNPAPLLAIA
jgi:hypothetical protein